MKIYTPAKINLCLDIMRKTESGYHEIRTVFYETDKFVNEIEIEETAPESEDLISSENEEGSESLAHKACTLLRYTYNIKKSVKIKIKRNIPMSSGLGGESSNAAAVLKHMNELWRLELTTDELLELGAKLGKDVPFFIKGGTALGENFGEKLTPLPHIELPLKIVPKKSMDPQKTKHAYELLSLDLCGKNTEKTDNLIEELKQKNIEGIAKNIHNDFETITPSPEGYHLSGSGPSYFKLETA